MLDIPFTLPQNGSMQNVFKNIFKYLFRALQGMIIGLSILIPGVSGGSMLMVFGAYEQAVSITSRDKQTRRKAIVFLIPYIIGIVLGVLLLAGVIKLCFERFTLQTVLMFVGLILGSLPMLIGHVKGKKVTWVCIALLVAMMAILIVQPWLSQSSTANADLTFSFGGVLMGILLGFIAATTMIIPGVSGSMVMLILGYYHSLIGHVDGFKTALFSLDWAEMLTHAKVLIPFGIGVIASLLLVTKALKWLFDKHPTPTYWAIIGLMVASPYAIFVKSNITMDMMTAVNIITGIVCLVIGFAVSFLMYKRESKG